jgi:hypothetical protein
MDEIRALADPNGDRNRRAAMVGRGSRPPLTGARSGCQDLINAACGLNVALLQRCILFG